MNKKTKKSEGSFLEKSPTGIQGLDEITNGGLPKGRPTLVCGKAGCGKTLFAMEFLVRGATEFNEPGVFMAFEETEKELTVNVASLGFELDKLVAKKMILLDHVHIERSEIEITGEFNLEGLFIRLNYAIDSIGAKRVVLDTIESLFSGLPNELIIRAELRRLFRWLKDKGVTTIITGESGIKSITRHGIEEYVSDCVILLDHRVNEQVSTRRLRIAKYRGTNHATNEFPFLIHNNGIFVMPITSLELDYNVSGERISSGIQGLDEMLGGKGFYKGSGILVSGTAGSGKSSIAAGFAIAACERGQRTIYFALEESPDQIIRNMNSIGLNLEVWKKKGLLRFHSVRPTFYGLEMHLATMIQTIDEFKPEVIVVDPINSFVESDFQAEAKQMVIRLMDFLKLNVITGLFTYLTRAGSPAEHTDMAISSSIDTWILLRDIETGGERNRGIYILKSRGMSHSNQIREFLITAEGVKLLDAYPGHEGVLTGTARIIQESKENEELIAIEHEIKRRKLELELIRKSVNSKMELLKNEFEKNEAEVLAKIALEEEKFNHCLLDRKRYASGRKADE